MTLLPFAWYETDEHLFLKVPAEGNPQFKFLAKQ